MKVLVITAQYAPDYGPSVPIYTALCEDLARSGCDVTVVTAFPGQAREDVPVRRRGRLFEEEMREGVRVIRTYVYSVPKSALWRRLLFHASFNVFSWLGSLRVPRPDVIFADHPTLWSGLPLLARAILPGTPFVYVVHDIYPDVLERLGMLNNRRILGLIDRVEMAYYRRAARVSVLSEGFRQNLLAKGVPDGKIAIVPACVDVDFVHPLDRPSKFRELWQLQDKFVVLYAGNIGLSQGLETALAAAGMLARHPEIVFVIVGEGATAESLRARAAELELANVRFFPFQPREDIPEVYGLADLSLVSLKSEIVVESVPSKTYTIMASGRPIVATVDRNSEVGRLFEAAGCGRVIPFGDPDALARTVLELHRDPALRRDMGRRGREYVVAHYSRQTAARLNLEIIERIKEKT